MDGRTRARTPAREDAAVERSAGSVRPSAVAEVARMAMAHHRVCFYTAITVYSHPDFGASTLDGCALRKKLADVMRAIDAKPWLTDCQGA